MLLWSTRVASPHCDCVFYVCKGGLAALPGSGFLDRSADNTLPPCLFTALGRELTSGFCRMRKRHLKRGSLPRFGARCAFDFGWHDFNRLGYREHRRPARATSLVLCARCRES